MRFSGKRGGFTLFEVILSLAILGGTVAVIAQAAWSGLENARMAQELVQAQLLCESVMGELICGIRPLESAQETKFDEDSGLGDPQQWVYAIDIAPADVEGMLEARVTVRTNSDRPRKVGYTLVRWMLDNSPENEKAGAEEERK
jgi:general secretion pathway protein I